MKNILEKYTLNREGATVIEYSLIAAAIGITILAAVLTIGESLAGFFEELSLYIGI